jgi:acyl carrier protein
MANNDDVSGRLSSIFQDVFQNNNLTLTRDMTAQDVENWDSMRHIQLITEVETAFGIKFRLREIMSMKNVGDLIDLIRLKRV